MDDPGVMLSFGGARDALYVVFLGIMIFLAAVLVVSSIAGVVALILGERRKSGSSCAKIAEDKPPQMRSEEARDGE